MSRWSQVCNSLCPCIHPSSDSFFMLMSKGQQADLQLNIPCLCFLFEGFEESCREHAPHAIFIRQTPHWFSCCLISAVARYFPTSKSPSPIPRLQLSHSITCSTLHQLRWLQGYGGKIRHLTIASATFTAGRTWAKCITGLVCEGHCYLISVL